MIERGQTHMRRPALTVWELTYLPHCDEVTWAPHPSPSTHHLRAGDQAEKAEIKRHQPIAEIGINPSIAEAANDRPFEVT